MQAVTTQTVPGAAGPVHLDPLVASIALNSLVELLPAGPERSLLGATLQWAPQNDPLSGFASLKPEQLSPAARPLLALIHNRDALRTEALIQGLDPAVRGTLEALSPATHLDLIEIPVWALHDENDPFIPIQESRLLAQDPRGRGQIRLLTVTLLKHPQFLDLPQLTPVNIVTTYLPNFLHLERFVEEPLATL